MRPRRQGSTMSKASLTSHHGRTTPNFVDNGTRTCTRLSHISSPVPATLLPTTGYGPYLVCPSRDALLYERSRMSVRYIYILSNGACNSDSRYKPFE